MESLAEDLKALRSEFADMRSSIEKFNAKVTEFDRRLVNVEKAQSRVIEVETRLSRLEEDVKSKEQWSRMNNVELKGIPEVKNENLYEIAGKVGTKISFAIEKSQINFITRIQTRDTKQAKPIIVCFNNRYLTYLELCCSC
jgi:predicted  nucleic acid-binding Zn-ribbon protein